VPAQLEPEPQVRSREATLDVGAAKRRVEVDALNIIGQRTDPGA
jgi:hypothetical protein